MSAPRPLPGPDHSEAFEELAVGWALHALEPEDAELFLPHLDTCALCRQVVQETVEVMADMAAAAPSAEPTQTLRDRLRAEVAITPQEIDLQAPATAAVPEPSGRPAGVPVVASLRTPVRRRWTSVLVAAAVAAVVGLGGWTSVLLGDRDDARQTANAEAAMVEAMLRPGRTTVVPVTDDDDERVATLLARDDEMQLVSEKLSANDRDAETYVLWGLDGGNAEAIGAFDIADSGVQLLTMDVSGADDFAGYGISIEPGRKAPSTPTNVVGLGSLPS